MARVDLKVKVVGSFKYEVRSFNWYDAVNIKYIHKMVDEDKNVYVWNTASVLACGDDLVNENAVIEIRATIKGTSEYKGEKQTELSRVKVVKIVEEGLTYEQILAIKKAERDARKAEQIASLKDGDLVWIMPYKQYKEHYSDCETVIDSFERRGQRSFIEVIIRNGRLKASGVRGMKFKGYEIEFEDGGKKCRCTFRAVSEENAMKQFYNSFPDAINADVAHIW